MGSCLTLGSEPRLKLEIVWLFGSLSPTLEIPGIPTFAERGLPYGFNIVALSMLGEAELLSASCLLLLYSSSSSLIVFRP